MAGLLGVGVFTLRHCAPWKYSRGYAGDRDRKIIAAPRDRREIGTRLWLPPIVPTTPAGEPSPMALTPWRVKALRMMARIRAREFVTSNDFRELQISPTIWRQQSWIIPAGRVGRLTRYVLGPGQLPDHGWETERDAIAAT